jgi:hypothetical protein
MNYIAYCAEFYDQYIHSLSFNSELRPKDNSGKEEAPQARCTYVEEADDNANKVS